MLSKVDLPHPDGPTMDTNSPGFTSSDTSTHRIERYAVLR
jgi:hypothetical protein